MSERLRERWINYCNNILVRTVSVQKICMKASAYWLLACKSITLGCIYCPPSPLSLFAFFLFVAWDFTEMALNKWGFFASVWDLSCCLLPLLSMDTIFSVSQSLYFYQDITVLTLFFFFFYLFYYLGFFAVYICGLFGHYLCTLRWGSFYALFIFYFLCIETLFCLCIFTSFSCIFPLFGWCLIDLYSNMMMMMILF